MSRISPKQLKEFKEFITPYYNQCIAKDDFIRCLIDGFGVMDYPKDDIQDIIMQLNTSFTEYINIYNEKCRFKILNDVLPESIGPGEIIELQNKINHIFQKPLTESETQAIQELSETPQEISDYPFDIQDYAKRIITEYNPLDFFKWYIHNSHIGDETEAELMIYSLLCIS